MRCPTRPLLTWLLALVLLLTQQWGLQHALGHALGSTMGEVPGLVAPGTSVKAYGPTLSADGWTAPRADDRVDAQEPADGACPVCLALASMGVGLLLAVLRWLAPRACDTQALPPPSRAPPSRPRPAYAARAPPAFQH